MPRIWWTQSFQVNLRSCPKVLRYAVQPALSGGTGPLIFGPQTGEASDRVVLGRLSEQGPLRQVVMDISAECVVAVFGKRGSGKSYTLGVLLEALAMRYPDSGPIGQSSRSRAALLLDTLNVFWSLANPIDVVGEESLFPEEVARLSAWTIKPPELAVEVWIPMGFRKGHTPSQYRDFSIAPSSLTADDIADLFELDAQSDLMGQLLVELREKAIAANPSFTFPEMLEILEADQELEDYFSTATLRGARQRLRWAGQLEIFSGASPTQLSDLLQPGGVSVLELGDVPNSLRTVIASVLLRRIHALRATASDAEKQLALNTRLSSADRASLEAFVSTALPPTWVLVDEAQNVLPGGREVKSSDAVVRFVREGRNFGLSFALTTQQPSAVDQRILAQADTVICHRLSVAQDIQRMRENLKCAEPLEVRVGGVKLDLSAWLRSLEPGCALVTNTDFDRVFAVEIRPRVTPHGGTGFRVRR